MFCSDQMTSLSIPCWSFVDSLEVSESCDWREVSSANISQRHWTKQSRSLIYSKNKRGPRTEPWGTPYFIGWKLEEELLMLTNCFRLERNDDMSVRNIGGNRYNSSFRSNSEWSITSNAFAKSTKRMPVNSSRLMLDNRLSTSCINAVWHDWFCWKPDWFSRRRLLLFRQAYKDFYICFSRGFDKKIRLI